MRIIASILIVGLVALLGGFAVIYAGAYDVAATEPHWPVTHWIMEMARMRSIKAHAAGITVPPAFDDPANIPIGVEHFAAHCAVCHGVAPSRTHSPISSSAASRVVEFAPDSTLEGEGFEPSVPRQRVNTFRCVASSGSADTRHPDGALLDLLQMKEICADK